jgi:hypothetical protein
MWKAEEVWRKELDKVKLAHLLERVVSEVDPAQLQKARNWIEKTIHLQSSTGPAMPGENSAFGIAPIQHIPYNYSTSCCLAWSILPDFLRCRTQNHSQFIV